MALAFEVSESANRRLGRGLGALCTNPASLRHIESIESVPFVLDTLSTGWVQDRGSRESYLSIEAIQSLFYGISSTLETFFEPLFMMEAVNFHKSNVCRAVDHSSMGFTILI